VVLSARTLNPKENNPQRIEKRNENQQEIWLPVEWKDVNKFEKQNKTISVNVRGYDRTISSEN